MTKKSVVLISVAVVLGAVSLGMRMDWRTPEIKILPQIRPPLRGRPAAAVGDVPVYPVTFAFDKKYSFTEIRVVSVDDELTNKYPHEVWHMISDSNSIPTKALQYGAMLRGMKPKVPRAQPEALEPEVSYHLYLHAGKATGAVKFVTHELVKPAQ